MYRPTVVFVSPLKETCDRFWDLANKIGFIPIRKYSLPQLFAHLNDPVELTDLIIFDIDELYKENNRDVFRIIGTIDTLSGFANNRSPMLSVLVGDDSDLAVINDAMNTKIQGFIPKISYSMPDEDELAMRTLLEGKSYVSDQVSSMVTLHNQKRCKIINYVSSPAKWKEPVLQEHIKKLESLLPVKITKSASLQEVITSLSRADFFADYVAIDLEDMSRVEDANLFEVSKLLSTLISCSSNNRKCKIVGIVTDTLPYDIIAEASGLDAIDYLIRGASPGHDVYQVAEAMRNYLSDGPRLDPAIEKLLDNDRKLVTFISARSMDPAKIAIKDRLVDEFNISARTMLHVRDMISLLNNQKFISDFVIVNIKELTESEGIRRHS